MVRFCIDEKCDVTTHLNSKVNDTYFSTTASVARFTLTMSVFDSQAEQKKKFRVYTLSSHPMYLDTDNLNIILRREVALCFKLITTADVA